jgi:hypothetical protein
MQVAAAQSNANIAVEVVQRILTSLEPFMEHLSEVATLSIQIW